MKHYRKVLFILSISIVSLLLVPSSTSAATSSTNIVETTFFGNIEDDGSGCGVYTILNLVLDILSIGVGILGVIGISIVGIKYLTSAGNEEQARTSRRRIFEILIGLAVYAILYAGINWLVPGGKLNTGSECKTLSAQELEQRRATENTAKNNTSGSNSSSKKNSSKKTQKKFSTKSTTKPKNSKGNGYTQVITLGGRTFKLYKQYKGSYRNNAFGHKISSGLGGTIAANGCGAASLTIVLSGYGIKKDVGAVAKGLINTAKK